MCALEKGIVLYQYISVFRESKTTLKKLHYTFCFALVEKYRGGSTDGRIRYRVSRRIFFGAVKR